MSPTVSFLLTLLIGVNSEFISVAEYLKKEKHSILSRETTAACDAQKSAYLNGLLNGTNWALQMLDSTGKIPSGIMRGNAFDYGFYDQCLDINEIVEGAVMKGNYCVLSLLIPYGMFLNSTSNEVGTKNFAGINRPQLREDIDTDGILLLSVCIPDQCVPADIFGELGYASDCEVKGEINQLDASDIACVTFLAVIVAIMVLSTAYDVYLQRHQQTVRPIFVAFSVYTNGKKILATTNSNNPNQILCFHGLKSISLLWVIVGHSISLKNLSPFVINQADTTSWVRNWYAVYVLQAPLAVDTFLFLSGTLLSYNFLKTMSKPNAKFNIFLYYLHRYIRLTPALAVLYFVTVTIVRRIGSGPMWYAGFDSARQLCLDNWWAFFLYVQNYVDTDNQCLGHTWYLSVDMQIYLISPLILLPLLKYPKITLLYGMPVIIFVSMLVPFVVLFVNNIEFMSTDYGLLYYNLTHNRLAPWLIGIAFGVVLLKIRNRKFEINWYLNVMMWLLDFVIIGIIFFTQDDVAYNYNKWKTSFYFSTYRAAWSVCLCWIVFACVNGSGGVINWFLSAPVFQVIGKLSYSIYLVHMTIILMVTFRQRNKLFFSDFDNIYDSIGPSVLSVIVGAFWTLAFESPMITIERIIFGGGPKKPNEAVTYKAHPTSVKIDARIEDKIRL